MSKLPGIKERFVVPIHSAEDLSGRGYTYLGDGKWSGPKEATRVFGVFPTEEMKMSFTKDFLAQIAEVAHAANLTHCAQVEDFTHKPWKETPKEIQESSINGVLFALEHPEATAESLQAEWRRYKEAEGWTYGKVKDLEKKTHPNLCPFGDLSAHERLKDFLFISIVRAYQGAYKH